MAALQVDVEVASPDRWADVRALRLAALADAPDAYASTLADEREQPESWWRRRLARRDASTLIATLALDGQTPVPVGIAVVAPAHDDDRAAVGIYAVWVDPRARGRGVGDALIDAAVELARRADAERLLLDVGDHNGSAIALYERHGFVRTGRGRTLPPPRAHVTEHERGLVLRPRRRGGVD